MAKPFMPHTAMVFAAGLGTRMRPITLTTPKPMVKVLGKPLIDYRLDALAKAGVRRAVINTFYLPEQIEAHVHQRTDMEIITVRETERLETGGGMLNAMEHLGSDPIFVVNCDVIWRDGAEPTLPRMAAQWNSDTMDSLLLLQNKSTAIGYDGAGDFNLLPPNVLFWNKPTPQPYVYTGLQILNPQVVERYRPHYGTTPFSLSVLFKDNTLEDNTLSRICGIEHTGQWLHIDSPEGLKVAESHLETFL